MSGDNMSQVLASAFGTNKLAAVSQHTPEDLVKQANVNFFTSLCAAEGINVQELTDPQVQELWKTAMEMKAAEHEPEPKKEEKKKEEEGKEHEKEAASREWQEKRAAAVKVAEAEAMGRIMAHALVDELQKIAEFPPKEEGKEHEGKEKEEGKEHKGFPFKHEGKEGKEKEGSAAARASAVVNAFQATKQASTGMPAFDKQAAFRAIEIIKESGMPEEDAFARVNAAWTLGLKESTKIASVSDQAQALEVRALEICEAAGFQVNWA